MTSISRTASSAAPKSPASGRCWKASASRPRTTRNGLRAAPRSSMTSTSTSGKNVDRNPCSNELTLEIRAANEAGIGRALDHRTMEAKARGLAARGVLDLVSCRGPELRRSRRTDRGHASHSGRGEALALGTAVPACAELLHAAAGPRSATAPDLYRLADASHAEERRVGKQYT